MAGHPPPDDDPAFLERLGKLRKAPRSGEVVERPRPPRRAPEERDDDPLEQDVERFSGVTRRCPSCNKDVFDDSAVCYHCGHAFERTTAGSSRTPTWVIVTALVLVAGFVIAVVLRMI